MCRDYLKYEKKKFRLKKNKTIVLIKRHRDTASYFYLINKILSYDIAYKKIIPNTEDQVTFGPNFKYLIKELTKDLVINLSKKCWSLCT